MTRLLAMLATVLAAVTVSVSAAPPQPVLVELFTSEGCSSCPPADRLLSELLVRQPVSGARIIGLAEHVDYWDGLGWPDRFAAASYTARQRDYAKKVARAGVFTPQIVVDGRYSLVGSDRGDALDAVRQSIAVAKVPIVLRWVVGQPHRLEVRIDATPGAPRVLLATTVSGVRSKIARGENAGLTLSHVAVVRALQDLGGLAEGRPFERSLDVDWPEELSATGRGVVLIVQDPVSGRVLGVASLDA